MASDGYVEGKLADYEEIIKQIKDVISARIVTNEFGEIIEIHVLSGPGRSPKQIVRDIESAFMAQFGINIDHKKVSVAQMQDDEGTRPMQEIRPKLTAVTVVSGGRKTEATVELEIGDEIYSGTALGPSTVNNKLRVIAQATVLAIENYLKGTCNMVTDDICRFSIAGKDAVAIAVSLITNVGEERLIGSAFLNNDEREAAVKATLAAINRRMALLLNE
ncbi:hypothetical protein [Phosphitispora sp. TUW77]|uniref:hypothetical protein n=1 Tax=Phosphitispora sp. TUW77 TaxID=3152361 RepID=UPI003AB31A86